MEDKIIFFVALIILIGIISGIAKRIKFPRWAKFRPTTRWGIRFFDDNTWVKICLIKFAQLFIVIGLLALLLFKTSINFATRLLPVKVPKV